MDLGYWIALRGTVTTAEAPVLVWTLPHGARPVEDMDFTVQSANGPVEVTVMAEGSIVVHAIAESADLSTIEFEAAHVNPPRVVG